MSDGALPAGSFPVYYRLAPAMTARLLGLLLVVLAVVMFVTTAIVALAGASLAAILVVLVVSVVIAGSVAWWLVRVAWVVRCDAAGYAVRLVRGAGVKAAPWSEVGGAATAYSRDVPCLVLQLTEGRSTTIPTTLLAIDREQFVREMQRRLGEAQGIRPL